MPALLRKIEFLGGPWDGGWYLALDDEERITIEGSGTSPNNTAPRWVPSRRRNADASR